MHVAARISSITLNAYQSNKCFEYILYGRKKQHSVPRKFLCMFQK